MLNKTINNNTNTDNSIINSFKKLSVFTKISFILITLVIFISLTAFIFLGKKYITVEVEKFKFRIDKGIEKISEQIGNVRIEVEKGYGDKISLKNDAFTVVDDTKIILKDGLNDMEIEKALNNHKYGKESIQDGDLTDAIKNGNKFNKLWGIDEGVNNTSIFDKDFTYRLKHTHEQHIRQVDWDYFNQRSIPKIGNVICVPSSAVILLNALGYDVNVEKLLKFFSTSKDLKTYAKTHFGKWINSYIEMDKLYQITGMFTYGLNTYMKKHYPDFPYKLDYNYWSIEEIAEYVETFGLMSSTYLPSYVLYGERSGGHMIVISKVYRDFNGNIIGFAINDPFGNPNVAYSGRRGWDGKNVVISLDDMLSVMKSYNDDHNRGSKHIFRVLYFKNK